jgi:hypothetical protein
MLDFLAYKLNGPPTFVEVKNGKKKLTDAEIKFIQEHPECSVVIRSEEQAIAFCAGDLAREHF